MVHSGFQVLVPGGKSNTVGVSNFKASEAQEFKIDRGLLTVRTIFQNSLQEGVVAN